MTKLSFIGGGKEKRAHSARFSFPHLTFDGFVISMERSDWEIYLYPSTFLLKIAEEKLIEKWNEKAKTRFNTPPDRFANLKVNWTFEKFE